MLVRMMHHPIPCVGRRYRFDRRLWLAISLITQTLYRRTPLLGDRSFFSGVVLSAVVSCRFELLGTLSFAPSHVGVCLLVLALVLVVFCVSLICWISSFLGRPPSKTKIRHSVRITKGHRCCSERKRYRCICRDISNFIVVVNSFCRCSSG